MLDREAVYNLVGKAVIEGDYISCIQRLAEEVIAADEINEIEVETEEGEVTENDSAILTKLKGKLVAGQTYQWKDLASMAGVKRSEIQALLKDAPHDTLYVDGHHLIRFQADKLDDHLRELLHI